MGTRPICSRGRQSCIVIDFWKTYSPVLRFVIRPRGGGATSLCGIGGNECVCNCTICINAVRLLPKSFVLAGGASALSQHRTMGNSSSRARSGPRMLALPGLLIIAKCLDSVRFVLFFIGESKQRAEDPAANVAAIVYELLGPNSAIGLPAPVAAIISAYAGMCLLLGFSFSRRKSL